MDEVMIVGNLIAVGADTEEPSVSEDDWELGPVCSTEHEECESCQ